MLSWRGRKTLLNPIQSVLKKLSQFVQIILSRIFELRVSVRLLCRGRQRDKLLHNLTVQRRDRLLINLITASRGKKLRTAWLMKIPTTCSDILCVSQELFLIPQWKQASFINLWLSTFKGNILKHFEPTLPVNCV